MKPMTLEEMSAIQGGSTPGSCAFVGGLGTIATLTGNIPAAALSAFYFAAFCTS